MTQNIHRGEWSTHHTADRTRTIANLHNIDWNMYKEIFNTDGKQKEGFSSRKTSDLRTYITKIYTNTLPMMDILHKKWDIYLNNICPRCTTSVETNDHLWTCSYATEDLQDIIDEFRRKYSVPPSLCPHIEVAVRAIPTAELTKYLKDFFPTTGILLNTQQTTDSLTPSRIKSTKPSSRLS
jgi:hypothetical protein